MEWKIRRNENKKKWKECIILINEIPQMNMNKKNLYWKMLSKRIYLPNNWNSYQLNWILL